MGLFVLTIIFFFTTKSIDCYPVSCKLEWVSEGYGNVAPNSVESGSNEFVARVFHNDKWIPGRLLPSKGRIFVTENAQVFDYDTYEVLTNPDRCLLDWTKSLDGTNPSNSVAVDELPSSKIYIGRGIIAGLALGGKVIPEEKAIYIAYEGREETRRSYEVLRSFYPPLKVSLTKFDFQIPYPSLPNLKSTELIGSDEVQSSLLSDGTYNVDHSKVVHERFSLTEDSNWTGFSYVSYRFSMWYGSSDVYGEFNLNPDNPTHIALTIFRDKNLRIQRSFIVNRSVGASHHVQFCSTVNIIEDLLTPFPFEAEATYEAENMTADQIKIILTGLGRNVKSTFSAKHNAVVGRINGNLDGRFATHLSSFTGPLDVNGVCNGYATKRAS